MSQGATNRSSTRGLGQTPLSVTLARGYRQIEARMDFCRRRRCTQGGLQANAYAQYRTRQRRILEALVDIRAALIEALRLDLGHRFLMELDVSDWEGWPRLELRLIDTLAEFIPGKLGIVPESMSAGALERESAGMIFLALNHREVLARLTVDEDTEIEQLPETVASCAQQFLERVLQRSTVTPPEARPMTQKAEQVLSPRQNFPPPSQEASKKPLAPPPGMDDVDLTLAGLNFVVE